MTGSVSSIPFLNLRLFHSIPIFFLLLIAACRPASADVAKAKPATCVLTDAEAAGLSGDASTDIHAVSNYSKTVTSLLIAGKFEQLDCLADSARSRKERFAGGMWKIHNIYSGLEKPQLHATQKDWDTHMELLQRWVATRPASITARVALAESYVSYGWDARGSGLGDSVSESGWKLLQERAGKAKQTLEQASALSAKCPEWYVAMQDVALGENWDSVAKQALFEQAVNFEPAYYYYYRMYAYSVLPQWGGKYGEAETFLQKAADGIGGDAGDILYFRVAPSLGCDNCPFDHLLDLSWPRILKGFEAVEKQNGVSLDNLNHLAYMASKFLDAVVADKSFARIGDQWDEDTWELFEQFDRCRQWAKKNGPRYRAAEESAEVNLRTAEGQQYKTAFDEKLHTWIQPCIEAAAGSMLGNFEVFIRVGKEGTIENIKGLGGSPVIPCLSRKLADFQEDNQAVLPPPPQPAYWVRFDFNPEHPASVAFEADSAAKRH